MSHKVNKVPSVAARLEAAFQAWSTVDISRTVFLGSLPSSTSRAELLEVLSHFGKVQKLVLPKEQKSKKLKGHGKAVFYESEAAKYALSTKETSINGSRFEIRDWVDPLTYIHRRDLKAQRKVYVKHKSTHTREILQEYFQQFGPIEEVDMRFNFNSNRSRNFCYIVFKNEESALQAAIQVHELLGQPILCEMCRPTDPLSTITVPSNKEENHYNDFQEKKEDFWHNIKQLKFVKTGSDSEIIFVQQNNLNKQGPFTCTELLLKPSISEPQCFPHDKNQKIPKAQASSMVSITKPKRTFENKHETSIKNLTQQKDIILESSSKILSPKPLIHSAAEDNWYFSDLTFNPIIESQNSHSAKPTSKKYSKKKSKAIDSFHRMDSNLCFKRYAASPLRQVLIGRIPVEREEQELWRLF